MATFREGTKRALEIVRKSPRVVIANIKDNPGSRKRDRIRGRSKTGGNYSGRGQSGQGRRNTRTRIGFEGGSSPFYLKIPKFKHFYMNHHLRRQYLPVSLEKLQSLIDLGRINPDEPIDVTSFVHAGAVNIDIYDRHYGIHLTDEGADIFKAQVNIEVQWISETGISAVERNGGILSLGYYDPQSLNALAYPLSFFNQGKPIPRRALPPKDLVPMYADPEKRGYLADPEKIKESRLLLAQKFGYALPDLTDDPKRDMLRMRKDPRQVFFGLQPGWFVNLTDRTVLKPLDEDLQEYYKR